LIEFDEVTEGEEIESKEYLKSKWSRLEKVVGSPERIKRIAKALWITGKSAVVFLMAKP